MVSVCLNLSDSPLIFIITIAFLCGPISALHTPCVDSLVLALLPRTASEHNYIYIALQCVDLYVFIPAKQYMVSEVGLLSGGC